MAGPCSYPAGDKAEWERLNEGICNNHKYCWPERPSLDAEMYSFAPHEWVTKREYLVQRNKLRTGKTV